MRMGDDRLVKVVGSVFSDFITAVERLDPAGHARVICKVMHMGMLRLRHIAPLPHHDPNCEEGAKRMARLKASTMATRMSRPISLWR